MNIHTVVKPTVVEVQLHVCSIQIQYGFDYYCLHTIQYPYTDIIIYCNIICS